MIHWPTRLLIWLSIPIIKGVGPMAHSIWYGYDHRDPNPYPGTWWVRATHVQHQSGADRDIADNEESPVVSVSNLVMNAARAFAMPESPKGACKIALFCRENVQTQKMWEISGKGVFGYFQPP